MRRSATAGSSGSTTRRSPPPPSWALARPAIDSVTTRPRSPPGRPPSRSVRRHRPIRPGGTSPRHGSATATCRRHRGLPPGRPPRARGGQGGDRDEARLADQGVGRSEGRAQVLRQGSRRCAAHLGHDDPHRGDRHRVVVRALVGRGPGAVRCLGARQGGRRRGRVLAAVDGHAAARQRDPPRLQHVRPVPVGPHRRALVWVAEHSWSSISCVRPRARSAASSSVATARRSGHRARSSVCSACCWPRAASTTRSIGRAAPSWASWDADRHQPAVRIRGPGHRQRRPPRRARRRAVAGRVIPPTQRPDPRLALAAGGEAGAAHLAKVPSYAAVIAVGVVVIVVVAGLLIGTARWAA